ncbi:MAG: hypothetical protein M0P91_14395 [Sulfuricurvum sp.]|jgi:hypothetical protein|uniref:hypothetical protein n=1 Tax=Sulfuricurvum sp. TaxID=2025608 RepID=UPI0025F2656F|nr:hypothetical protein [Sulfuricurvum sp.]MCK9374367.1 hypothetical protein [Sulfuricurvum sp.]
MADFNLFYREYNSFISTFKKTSFDSENNFHLCKDTSVEVIDFDAIIENMYPDSNHRPKSFDSIYFDETKNHVYLIEFKNQKKPDKQEIEKKLIDGKRELEVLLNRLSISKNSYEFIFCLVYNKFTPKEERYKRGLFKSTTFEFLNKHKETFFINDIYTEDVSFFTTQFKKKTAKDLQC